MACGIAFSALSQDYPEPEFLDEVCFLKKGDTVEIIRLEKSQSKMDTRLKAGGIGGAESGYVIDGEKSSLRVTGNNPSFVYASSGVSGGLGMMDLSNRVILYKADVSRGMRKVLLQKGGGYFGGKVRSSDKLTFSVRAISDGYWEIVIDKPLDAGEYVFTSMGSSTSMDGSVTMFAFGVDGGE